MNRRAKIAATIGPSSQDEATITGLIKAGMNVARLNFSHSTHQEHAQIIQRLRKIAEELSSPIGIMQDLQGPKIRVGELKSGSVNLTSGQTLTLTTQHLEGNENTVPIDLPQLPGMVQPGDCILLDDGNMELSVLSSNAEEIQTKVITGGELKTHKGINLPGKKTDNIPCLSEKDIQDLAFGLEQNVDIIALSFVRSPEDIHNLKRLISQLNPTRKNTPIIAKIEKPEALENLEAIILASEGVLVARGDLGVELPPAKVPIAQKRIITSANKLGKIVFIATQLLDSMINNILPTRAEASDIANAIFDGTDAVLLTGETASGKHPILVVETMDTIIREAEKHTAEWSRWCSPSSAISPADDAFFIAQAAHELAHDRNVAAVAVFTKTGKTAELLAKTRPDVDILAFTPNRDVYRQLSMVWGVIPHQVPYVETIEDMIHVVDDQLINTSNYQPGQQVVLVCGFPVKAVRPANMTIIHTIGEKP
jgi:pyruvate kinase